MRSVLGAVAAIQGCFSLATTTDATAATWGLGGLAIASGAALMVGFLTPGASAVAGLSTILITAPWTHVPPSSRVMDDVAALLVIANSAALALLGPGAHSIDAYLFGWLPEFARDGWNRLPGPRRPYK